MRNIIYMNEAATHQELPLAWKIFKLIVAVVITLIAAGAWYGLAQVGFPFGGFLVGSALYTGLLCLWYGIAGSMENDFAKANLPSNARSDDSDTTFDTSGIDPANPFGHLRRA